MAAFVILSLPACFGVFQLTFHFIEHYVNKGPKNPLSDNTRMFISSLPFWAKESMKCAGAFIGVC